MYELLFTIRHFSWIFLLAKFPQSPNKSEEVTQA